MRYTILVMALAFAACHDTTAPMADVSSRSLTYVADADGNIPGHYIVAVDWDADAAAVAAAYGIQPQYVYEQLLNGFAATISDAALAALKADPRVLRVSVQRQVQKLETTTVAAPSWGIDRIDQRALPLNGTYSYDVDASNVRAYVIDTGVRVSHSEFEGRASIGWDAYANDPTDPLLGYDGSGDCDGHGTHVSGTIGGRTFGIAKKVTIVGVRVLNCAGYGSDADVLAGMDWVAKNGVLPAVANMSLGDVVPSKTMGTSTEMDNGVAALIASGVSLSVAAGNGWGNGTVGADACMFPIANVPTAITVGATGTSDAQTMWTNYGSCVDIYAPGSSIISSTFDNDNSSGSKSGTSMATPHVAGVAALVLAQAPGLTPQEVRDLIVDQSTKGIVRANANNLTANLLNNNLLYSRVVVPVDKKGRKGHTVPCTPRRQRDGVC